MTILKIVNATIIALTAVLGSTNTYADTTYSPPKISGKLVDQCVKDGARNNCDRRANKIAADAFCQAQDNQDAQSWRINTRNVIPLAVKRVAIVVGGRTRFIDIVGVHTFTQIVCKSEQETQRFSRPVQNGMRIDKCVQGAGWGLLDPQRCNRTRQREIAKKFCLEKSYRDQFSYRLEGHTGNHAILTFRKGSSYRNGVWTQVVGGDAFREIICVR